MQRKINDTVICLQMGKNLMAKTPLGVFQVTTFETPLLSQQAVTSKEFQVPYQPIVEPLPQYLIGLGIPNECLFWRSSSKMR